MLPQRMGVSNIKCSWKSYIKGIAAPRKWDPTKEAETPKEKATKRASGGQTLPGTHLSQILMVNEALSSTLI